MLVTTRAIVLRTIRHGDNTVVLKAWTEHAGLRSYVVRVGGKRKGPQAALQALNRVELVANETEQRELHTLREVRVERPYHNIPVDPIRTAVALFVQEVLYKVLRQESADPALTAAVVEALEALDQAPDLRHYPLVFLLLFSEVLGFRPEPPGPGEDRFDLREGHFLQGASLHGHTLPPALSAALATLLPLSFATMHTATLPGSVRRELLDHLLLYFRMHLEGFGEMRSPAILHQVLG